MTIRKMHVKNWLNYNVHKIGLHVKHLLMFPPYFMIIIHLRDFWLVTSSFGNKKLANFSVLFESLTVKARSMDTHLLWTPHYCGQFDFSQRKESPYIFFKFNSLNTDTPLIQRLSMAPSVSILMEYHCSYD